MWRHGEGEQMCKGECHPITMSPCPRVIDQDLEVGAETAVRKRVVKGNDGMCKSYARKAKQTK